jgi:hypothetical protein
LKSTHLVLAKEPLPEEAIFNQNKAATERRRAARKAQHRECHIAKRDRNDNRIKRQKAGVGDSPRGPLKQWGKPHLKPATKPKYVKPNHAGA